MATTSALSLSEKLAQRQQQESEAAQSRMQELQQQHESSLQQLSTAALDTTRSVTAAQQEALSSALKASEKAVKAHAGDLRSLHTLTLQRLRWLMLWPLLATVALCLLMLASATIYSVWTVSDADDQVERKQQQIRQAEATFCATPVGQKVCRPPQPPRSK
jgi:hypothetical protein